MLLDAALSNMKKQRCVQDRAQDLEDLYELAKYAPSRKKLPHPACLGFYIPCSSLTNEQLQLCSTVTRGTRSPASCSQQSHLPKAQLLPTCPMLDSSRTSCLNIEHRIRHNSTLRRHDNDPAACAGTTSSMLLHSLCLCCWRRQIPARSFWVPLTCRPPAEVRIQTIK